MFFASQESTIHVELVLDVGAFHLLPFTAPSRETVQVDDPDHCDVSRGLVVCSPFASRRCRSTIDKRTDVFMSTMGGNFPMRIASVRNFFLSAETLPLEVLFL